MADFQPRKAGDKFSISAVEINAVLESAVAHKNGKASGASILGSNGKPFLVRNNTSPQETVERYRAVMLGNPVTLPASDPDEFKNRLIFDVSKNSFSPSTTAGRWCVVQKDCNYGELSPAVVMGATVCWVNIDQTFHRYVDVAINSYVPKSVTLGAARLLWVAGGAGSATATGEQWAVILLDRSVDLPTPRTKYQPLVCIDDFGNYGFDDLRFGAV